MLIRIKPFVFASLLTMLCGYSCLAQTTAEINVKLDQPTVKLSPVLYGLFFEDINYAADGGLYAELVQNRSFEFYPVQGWSNNSHKLHPLYSWSKIERDGGKVAWQVTNESPLNLNNTKYVELSLSGKGVCGISNCGFGGIILTRGAKYEFSFYARRTGDNEKPVEVKLVNNQGEELAVGVVPALTDAWKKYELTLTATANATDASLELTTTGGGELMLDMVSLFPQDTFRGRKNGMRKDLAQALADLNPGFLRFPGGCIAHGQGLENTYRWKDTVGDVAERKPNWNLWGYHQTYGLGYFEYFQMCEDIGASPLPVVPVGVSCGFRKPFEQVSMLELHTWVQDALDLIEFANGPVDSEWGKVRADMGHPKSFSLEYLCLGNEEHDTPEMRERFPYFVSAIRERYPEIKIIGTSGLGPEIPLFDLMSKTKVYSTDEHYYLPPYWYFANTNRFDTFRRDKPKIFVGEYASEGNTLYNALSEAAYLTGIERNADIVDMTCYAPLFAKYDYTQWTAANMIWFDNKTVVRTPNYYVQQLFSTNKGDLYCPNDVVMKVRSEYGKLFEGRVGIGTWKTAVEIHDAKLNGIPVALSSWKQNGGSFTHVDGGLKQTDEYAEGCMAIAPAKTTGESIVFELRARKQRGDEGFLVVFGDTSNDNYYWWNVGGWNNTQHGIERRLGTNSVERLATVKGKVESNRWYDLKVELTRGRIRCYLDNKLIHDYQQPLPKVHVSSTLDESSSELILKVVNPAPSSVTATINLQGVRSIAETGLLTLLSGPPKAVNNREKESVRPQTTMIPVAKTTTLELPATSLQVLRINVQ